MGTMTIETAMEWMKANHEEFARLVRIGYLPARAVNKAWQEAKHARDNSDRKVFEEKRDYWLKALNDFIVAEMDRGHRLELAERHGYKITDHT